MTFEDAMKAAREGKYVRHPAMGTGWTIGVVEGIPGYFCFNPHTGSEYGYTSCRRDVARDDWKIVKNKRAEK